MSASNSYTNEYGELSHRHVEVIQGQYPHAQSLSSREGGILFSEVHASAGDGKQAVSSMDCTQSADDCAGGRPKTVRQFQRAKSGVKYHASTAEIK